MALRIDLYSVDPGVDLERLPVPDLEASDHPTARWLGCASASDDDEQDLVDLLDRLGAAGSLAGLTTQGIAVETVHVTSDDATVADDAGPRERLWSAVLADCVMHAVAEERRLGWWTRYDQGGSVDDGPDEWPTAARLA